MVLLAHHLLASAVGVNCFFEVVPALLAQKRKEKAVCSHPSLPSSAMVTKHQQGSTSFQQDGKNASMHGYHYYSNGHTRQTNMPMAADLPQTLIQSGQSKGSQARRLSQFRLRFRARSA